MEKWYDHLQMCFLIYPQKDPLDAYYDLFLTYSPGFSVTLLRVPHCEKRQPVLKPWMSFLHLQLPLVFHQHYQPSKDMYVHLLHFSWSTRECKMPKLRVECTILNHILVQYTSVLALRLWCPTMSHHVSVGWYYCWLSLNAESTDAEQLSLLHRNLMIPQV